MRLPLLITVIIIISFFAFTPRLPNYIFPSARVAYLDKLVTQSRTSNHLDPQLYWETREFYYPGVFQVYQDGLEQRHIDEFSDLSGIKFKPAVAFPILVYSSKKWHSYEALVNTDVLSDLVDLPTSDPIYQDAETTIYDEGEKRIIYFIKSYEELKITNGFIYTKDEILKNYRHWFGVSVVTR